MDLYTSLMRTVVPILAGYVLGLAARAGLELDDATVTAYVNAACSIAYYVVFRGLEDLADRRGWRLLRRVAGVMLGWARPPRYPVAALSAVTPHRDDALG